MVSQNRDRAKALARLLLIRIESFKAERKIGKPEPSVEKQHGTSAEFALLAPEERKYFLKNFFELDERQVKVLVSITMKRVCEILT